jgi:hypothetical protein
MSAAHDLLADLAGIGAAIKPAGERLVLRAGQTAIPAALVSRVRAAKADLLVTLAGGANRPNPRGDNGYDRKPLPNGTRDRTPEFRIVEWLNQHPTPSVPGRCRWCGRPESPSAIVLPFGTEPGTHAWLHSECWPDWHRARRSEAGEALAALELAERSAPYPGGKKISRSTL